MRKKFFLVFVLITLISLLVVTPVNAKRCQLNSGAYIAHSKANIVKAWNYVWNGQWGQLSIMADRGELRKVGGSYYITVLEANDKYVKFSISTAPGKEIWTLTMFTQGCN